MKKLTLALLLAGSLVAIYSAPSFAAVVTHGCTSNCGPKIPGNPGGGNPGGGDPGNEPTSPGDPFIPGNPGDDNPGDPGDEPGNPGDNPGDPNDDPGLPGDNPGNPNDDPGNNPGNPGNPGIDKQAAAEMKACLARLDDLPPVNAEQINKFGQPNKVSLKPICEIKSLTEVGETFIANGNVYGLEPVLKSNELIRWKLGQSAYKARDVVGIDFDADGNAILLVHKQRG